MSNVLVCCRFRPANKNELSMSSTMVARVDGPTVTLSVDNPSLLEDTDGAAVSSGPNKQAPEFNFDHAFDWNSTQEQVYANTGRPFVKDIFAGYNTTIFAYGQTGSGKTHTMMGGSTPESKGIIPRLVESVFDEIEQAEGFEFTLKLSYVEIYNERIRDLLSPKGSDNLKIREGSRGVYIEGVTETYVRSYDHVLSLMKEGSTNRAVSSTNMNAESSRSHSVFILTLGQVNQSTGTKKGSKLTLVDLAGSEKVGKTGAVGQTLDEAKHINKSLSALGNVINALTSGGAHVPYRDSKLTRLLSDSLGGNSKTCLIITCSPMSYNLEETYSTLRFGSRAKLIKNKPKMNQEKSVAEYKKLLHTAHNKIKVQETIIEALERDVAELQNVLRRVDPAHLPSTLPAMSSENVNVRKLADELKALDSGDDEDDESSPASGSSPASSTRAARAGAASAGAGSATAGAGAGTGAAAAKSGTSTTGAAAAGTGAAAAGTATDTTSAGASSATTSTAAAADEESGDSLGDLPSSSLSAASARGGARDKSRQPSTASDLLNMMPARVSQLTLANAELESTLADKQAEIRRLLSQLADREEELQEIREISETEMEIKDLEIQTLMKDLEVAKKAAKAAGVATSSSSSSPAGATAAASGTSSPTSTGGQLERLERELIASRKKVEALERDHNIQLLELREEKRATQAKLIEALSELNERQLELEQRDAAAQAASAAAEASGTQKRKGSNHSRVASMLPDLSDIRDDKGKIEALSVSMQRKCEQYLQLQMTNASANEQIALLESMLAQAQAKSKDSSEATNRRVKELEDKLAVAEKLCSRLMESHGRPIGSPHGTLGGGGGTAADGSPATRPGRRRSNMFGGGGHIRTDSLSGGGGVIGGGGGAGSGGAGAGVGGGAGGAGAEDGGNKVVLLSGSKGGVAAKTNIVKKDDMSMFF